MARNLCPMVHARDRRERRLVRRLDADFKLHAAARHPRQHAEHLVVEVVDGHLKMEIRPTRFGQARDVLENRQEMRLFRIERPVDELHLPHIVAHEECELAQHARERQVPHARRRARQAVGTRKRTPAARLIVENPLADVRHFFLMIRERQRRKLRHDNGRAFVYDAIRFPPRNARDARAAFARK